MKDNIIEVPAPAWGSYPDGEPKVVYVIADDEVAIKSNTQSQEEK